MDSKIEIDDIVLLMKMFNQSVEKVGQETKSLFLSGNLLSLAIPFVALRYAKRANIQTVVDNIEFYKALLKVILSNRVYNDLMEVVERDDCTQKDCPLHGEMIPSEEIDHLF